MPVSLLNRKWFIILIMLPFFQPRSISEIPVVRYVYIGLTILSTFVALLTLSRISREKGLFIKAGSAFLILHAVWTALAAYLGGQGMSEVMNAVSITVFVLLVDFYLHYYCGPFLKAMFVLMGILIALNIVSMTLSPAGFGTDIVGNIVYFWNTTKHLITLYLAASVLGIIISLSKHNKISLWYGALLSIICINIFTVWTATAIVGIVCFYAFLLFFFYGGRRKRYNKNFYFYFVLFFALNAFITVFRVQEYFSLFIEGLLNKTITLTGRTNIWDSSFRVIQENFWLGTGQYAVAYYNTTFSTYMTAHNQILIIWIQGGFIGVMIYVSLLLSVGREIQRNNNTHTALILLAAINAMMVMFITENLTPAYPCYLLFLAAFRIPEIESYVRRKKQRGIIVAFK